MIQRRSRVPIPSSMPLLFLRRGGRGLVVVEFPQHLLDVLELLLGLRDRLGQALEALFVVRLVVRARLVLVCAKVLYLLAAVLHLGQAERGRRALEEVAEFTELLEIFALVLLSAPALARARHHDAQLSHKVGRCTHSSLSIFLNVWSAWPKKS